MQSAAPPSRSVPDWTAPGSTSVGPSADSEITWLLHRAAQRMRSATGEQAEKHGIQLRDYIVLSALDKTTLMSQLDRLERTGLVVRHSDPRDRRTRIPEITEAGNTLRAKVASACDSVEAAAM